MLSFLFYIVKLVIGVILGFLAYEFYIDGEITYAVIIGFIAFSIIFSGKDKGKVEVKKIKTEEGEKTVKIYHCPKCNATIENGIKLCGNCNVKIAWDWGRPRIAGTQYINDVGKETKGCMVNIIIIVAFIIAILIILSFIFGGLFFL